MVSKDSCVGAERCWGVAWGFRTQPFLLGSIELSVDFLTYLYSFCSIMMFFYELVTLLTIQYQVRNRGLFFAWTNPHMRTFSRYMALRYKSSLVVRSCPAARGQTSLVEHEKHSRIGCISVFYFLFPLFPLLSLINSAGCSLLLLLRPKHDKRGQIIHVCVLYFLSKITAAFFVATA